MNPNIKVCEILANEILRLTSIFILVEALDCDDHSFNELEDFGEISTMTLPDDNNFVISNDACDEIEQIEEKIVELDVSGDESMLKKDDDDIKLE